MQQLSWKHKSCTLGSKAAQLALLFRQKFANKVSCFVYDVVRNHLQLHSSEFVEVSEHQRRDWFLSYYLLFGVPDTSTNCTTVHLQIALTYDLLLKSYTPLWLTCSVHTFLLSFLYIAAVASAVHVFESSSSKPVQLIWASKLHI